MAEAPKPAPAQTVPQETGTIGKWSYFILPKKTALPQIAKPSDEDKPKLLKLWNEIALLQRHEDSLFNSRLQGFLVATSFLVAAFSQFKDTTPAHEHFRLSLVAFGFFLSLIMAHVLRRTAKAIEWYLASLNRLDKALYDDNCQPYRLRRIRQGTISSENRIQKPPVLFWLAICVPWAVTFLWVALFVFSYGLKPATNKSSEIAPQAAATPAATASPAAAATPAPISSPVKAQPAPPAASPTPARQK